MEIFKWCSKIFKINSPSRVLQHCSNPSLSLLLKLFTRPQMMLSKICQEFANHRTFYTRVLHFRVTTGSSLQSWASTGQDIVWAPHMFGLLWVTVDKPITGPIPLQLCNIKPHKSRYKCNKSKPVSLQCSRFTNEFCLEVQGFHRIFFSSFVTCPSCDCFLDLSLVHKPKYHNSTVHIPDHKFKLHDTVHCLRYHRSFANLSF